jgi:zinc transporter 9
VELSCESMHIRQSPAIANSCRYVAMHSMTEATSSHSDDGPASYMDAYPGTKSMSKTDIAIVLFGMLFPLVTQIGHAHAH